MILESDDSNTNTAVVLMCSMSPSAAKMVDLETYRNTAYSDEATASHILESVFLELTKDLQTIGLQFDVDFAEIVETPDTLMLFLKLVSYLLPNTFYSQLKKDDHLRICVGRILDGTLGDDETLIQTYLSELGGLDNHQALVPELHNLIDEHYSSITQSDVFTDYVRHLYQLVGDERLTTESDHEAHTTYRDFIKTAIVRFSDVVNRFENEAVYNDLLTIQNQFVQDLINPTNFADYYYLFTIDKATLPDDLIDLHNKRWYHYQVGCRWCVDYFIVRNMTPTPAQIHAMYCFAYAASKNVAEYNARIDPVMKLYPLEINNIISIMFSEQA